MIKLNVANTGKTNATQKAIINSLVLLLASAPAFALDGSAYGELYEKLPQLRGAHSATEIKQILTDNYSAIPQGVLELVKATKSSTFRSQLAGALRQCSSDPGGGGYQVAGALRQCSSDPGGGGYQQKNSADFRTKLSSDFAKAAAALMQCSSDPGGGGYQVAGALRQCSSDPGGGGYQQKSSADFRTKLSSDFAKAAEALMQCSSDPGGGGYQVAGALRQCSSDPGGGHAQRQRSTKEYRENLLSNFAREAAGLMQDAPAVEPGQPLQVAEALRQCSSDPGDPGQHLQVAGALRQCSSDPGGGPELRMDSLTSDFAKAATALMQCSSDPGSRTRLETDFARAGLALFNGEKGGTDK